MMHTSNHFPRGRNFLLSGLLITVAILLAIGCSTPGREMPVSETTATMNANQNVQEVAIHLESHYFEPNLINVIVDVPVRLTLTNGTALTPHNFTIHEPGAGMDFDRDVGGGETIAIDFTPTKTGKFEFFCDVGEHAEDGMVGTIVVMTREELQAR